MVSSQSPNHLKLVPRSLTDEQLLEKCDRQLKELKESVQKAHDRGLVGKACKSKLESIDLQEDFYTPSGTLVPSIRSEIKKSGEMVEFPTCHGERGDPWTNRSNYYWAYQYRDKSGRLRNVYVARRKIDAIKQAITERRTPDYICRLIRSNRAHRRVV